MKDWPYKAEYAPRIDLINRTKLETAIPLDTPFTIFVDPSDACNFKCRFCPTSDRKLMQEVGRPLRVMKFDLFKKIVDDICEFPDKIRVLRLYKDGEPLINKRIADMIKYAKDIDCADKIDTTTNKKKKENYESIKKKFQKRQTKVLEITGKVQQIINSLKNETEDSTSK